MGRINLRGLEMTTLGRFPASMERNVDGAGSAREDAQALLDQVGRGYPVTKYAAAGRARGWTDKRVANAVNAGVELEMFYGRKPVR